MVSIDAVRAAARFDVLATAGRQDVSGMPERAHAVQRIAVLFGCFSFVCVVALAFAVASSDVTGSARCSAAPVQPVFGAETAATMTVAPGNPCIVFLRQIAGSIDDLSIATPPRHGVVAVRGRSGVTYRSAQQHRGEDAFVLKLRGRPGTQSGDAIVRVRVEVR